ncbi:MAG: polysaccharide deacetylase family protein [Kiloniellales bacterium]
MSLANRARLKLQKRVVQMLLRRPLHIDPPRGLVSFTFDDFPASAYRTGGSILQRHGVRGTYYAAFGLLGGESEGLAMMTREDIAELLAHGHELGCHTFSHISARGLGRRQLARELDDNIAALTAATGLSSWNSFSYPFGDITLRAKRLAGSRFATCRSTMGGLNHGNVDLAALRSYPLSSRFDPVERTLAQIQEARQTRAWLIFFTHDVAERPSTYGCTPEHLEAAVSAAVAAGCDVVTVGEAARRLEAA